ncbi:hypothetical protein P692DRAFT_20955116 [Suillus brevipes Sb2]|nr:hypothetical protein P692DRAFT_20955116 [Suillus brevipes Sb2]
MHRAFDSEDIIHSILAYLQSSPKDLKTLAVTCSRLSGPALDSLWAEQYSFGPLFMCLTPDLRKFVGPTIHLAREPTPSEWERLQINAARVRRFIECPIFPRGYAYYGVSGPALQSLFKQFPPATLFPNLCAFNSQPLRFSRSDIPLYGKFMLPGLEALALDVSRTDRVEGYFGALPDSLRQLSISACRALAVLPSLEKLPKLLTLSIDGLDMRMTRQAITNIQRARYLHTLKLTLRKTSYDQDGGVMTLELSSLQRLSLSGKVLPQCTHYIRQITTCQLSHLTIEYRRPASPIEIAEFVESFVVSCQNHGSLTQFSVVDKSDFLDDERVIPLSSEIFRPLLTFTGLLSVVFEGIGNYSLDDMFINAIPDAWPGIQELKFASHRPASCAVSFTAMVVFASRCRSLQSLHLTCDATEPTVIPQDKDGTERLWPAQSALRRLHFGHSKVPQVGRMPFILAKVFPALSELKCSHFAGSLLEVFKLVKVLRKFPDRDESDLEYNWWEHIGDSNY